MYSNDSAQADRYRRNLERALGLPRSGEGAIDKELSLDSFLQGARLSQFSEPLKRVYGAARVADLAELDNRELDELGMKRLEKVRLQRQLQLCALDGNIHGPVQTQLMGYVDAGPSRRSRAGRAYRVD